MPTLRTLALLATAGATLGLAAFWILTLPAVVPATALPPYRQRRQRPHHIQYRRLRRPATPFPTRIPTRSIARGSAAAWRSSRHSALFTCRISRPIPRTASAVGARPISSPHCGREPRSTDTNLYPAFPYTSYQHMKLDDVRDLFAYLKTLPPVPGKVRRHDLAFPFNVRRLLGAWNSCSCMAGPSCRIPRNRRNGIAARIW